MGSIFTVAKYEFLRFVKTKSFYLTIVILSFLPLISLFGIGKITTMFSTVNQKMGICGLPAAAGNNIVLYDNKKQGLQALHNNDIGKLIIFPPDHIATGEYEEYICIGSNRLGWIFGPLSATSMDSIALPAITLAESGDISKRVAAGYTSKKLFVDNNDTLVDMGPQQKALIVGAISAALFFLFFMVASGFIADVIIKDKTEKIIETILSSISSFSFLTGRILASCCVATLQATAIAVFAPLWFFPYIHHYSATPIDPVSSIVPSLVPNELVSNLTTTSSLPFISNTSPLHVLNSISPVLVIGILLLFLIGLFFSVSLTAFIGSVSANHATAGSFGILFIFAALGSVLCTIIALSAPTPILNYIPFISIPIVIALITSSQISFFGFIISLVINLGSAIFVYYLAIKVYAMNFTMAGKSLVSIKSIVRAIK